MLHFFDFARELNFLSISVRLLCAVICGGVVGLERELKRRPAGFRTHILLCLGASITTLTSQYLYLTMNQFTDVARLGAQVIAGIGFIGAGAIIVTKRKRIKGLTTAAGLWTSAIIGLVCGAGYIECALAATILILIAELFLSKIEYKIARDNQSVNLYLEYSNASAINEILNFLKAKKINISDLEITRADGPEDYYYCALLSIQGNYKNINEDLFDSLRSLNYVKLVNEL